jgi:hypothetical protein
MLESPGRCQTQKKQEQMKGAQAQINCLIDLYAYAIGSLEKYFKKKK